MVAPTPIPHSKWVVASKHYTRGQVMPYKDKEKDRLWHKLVMRERRLKGTIVTPQVTPRLDADGNIIPEDE